MKVDKEKLIDDIKKYQDIHKNYRWGQAVFNYCDEYFGGVARKVQFGDGVDCFYNDDEYSNFLDCVIKRLNDND